MGATVVLLFGALLARFALVGGGHGGPAAASAPIDQSTAGRVTRLQADLQRNPGQPAILTDLGLAYLTRAKETADPSYYTLAQQSLDKAAAAAPSDLRTLVGRSLLDSARHDFRGALALGQRAATNYPASADALGVIVDAQVELGRYADASLTAQRMVQLKPNLASFARISYLRELQGDPQGALAAMTQAVTAGAGSANDLAYVQTLLGDLERGQGRHASARAAYGEALRSVPSYGPAEVGLARVAAAKGDLPGAAALLGPLTTRLPLPETVALYGDVLALMGRRTESARQYALVRQIERLQQAGGVVVDFESARFEADHAKDPGGSPARAVALARAASVARPTIYGADVLGWALRQAGRPAEAMRWANSALRFKTRDASLWWHRAAIEADLGHRDAARRDLATALSIDPSFSVRDAGAVRALAKDLGVS